MDNHAYCGSPDPDVPVTGGPIAGIWPGWMERVLATTRRDTPAPPEHRAFPEDEVWTVQYRALCDPEYIEAMRMIAEQADVTMLDLASVAPVRGAGASA